MNLNFKFKIKNSGKGFTLIELLVVMAIIGILSTIALVNSGKNDDRDVRMEAERFVTFLRDVQNKALVIEDVSGASYRVCGFGVHKNTDSELWVYYVETPDLNTGCGSVANTYPGGLGDPYKLETFTFRNGVTIGSLSDLFFLSPNGEVYTNGGNSASDFPVSITLTKSATSISGAVKVEISGRIY